jgi:hypothetical protein
MEEEGSPGELPFDIARPTTTDLDFRGEALRDENMGTEVNNPESLKGFE